MSRRRPPPFVELQVACLDGEGRGVGCVEGRCIRAKNALPGEHVRVRVLRRQRGEWWGAADEVLAASPIRQTAPCPVFPRCGGCAVQQLDAATQMAAKQARLQALLADLQVQVDDWRAPVLGPRYHYRSKARLGVRLLGDQPYIGFRETYSSRVARMNACLVLTPALSRLLRPLRLVLAGLDIRDAVPQVELAAGDGEQAMILRHLRPLRAADAAALRSFAQQWRVKLFVQPDGPDSVRLFAGPGESELLGYANLAFGLHLHFHPQDFTQVNFALNQRLVADVVWALGAPRGLTADLFCGIGNFTLPLARRGHRVLGLEAGDGCLRRAQDNAKRNGLTGLCAFRRQDLYDDATLPREVSAAVADPPRSGLGPGLAAVLGRRVRRLAYVSCNPASFARDARHLADLGFGLAQAGIYDMFPNTAHSEILGLFVRSGDG